LQPSLDHWTIYPGAGTTASLGHASPKRLARV
jgi:hypothetical protein